jgi:hypothetical protein
VVAPAGSCGGDGCCQLRYALLRQIRATAAAKGERRASVGTRGGARVVGRLWGKTHGGVQRRRPWWISGRARHGGVACSRKGGAWRP